MKPAHDAVERGQQWRVNTHEVGTHDNTELSPVPSESPQRRLTPATSRPLDLRTAIPTMLPVAAALAGSMASTLVLAHAPQIPTHAARNTQATWARAVTRAAMWLGRPQPQARATLRAVRPRRRNFSTRLVVVETPARCPPRPRSPLRDPPHSRPD